MRILLFGKNGQVGWELNRSLLPLGEIAALGHDDVDFSNPESLRSIVRDVNPDVIVNAVAYTAVDRTEEDESLAFLINAKSPEVLAEEALKINALLVHYSTDYVFDGAKTSCYTEDDKPNPVNAYGRTKLAGEVAIQSSACDYLILRTSWVYASRGKNFLLTILKLAQEKETLSIVCDQLGAPTSARLIAESTLLCIHSALRQRPQGDFLSATYHLTATGKTSWHDFAETAIRLANEKPGFTNKVTSIVGISTDEYKTPAKRPLNSCLSSNKLMDQFDIALPGWMMGLQLCIEELYSGKR